jgi:hypothetical protein
MYVYVKNHDGAALMPCTPAKARKLLRAGKATIVDYRPFTIQLTWQCEGHTQDMSCGIDKGSSITGLTCVGNGTILLAAEIHLRKDGGKDTLTNLITLCKACHHRLHKGDLTFNARGMSGHLDQIAQRTMQGKTHLYTTLSVLASLTTVYGYETATYRKYRNLPKTHIIDALCIATLTTGEVVSAPDSNIYRIGFRPRQTRKQYHSLPQKRKGRVKYQVNDELQGFHKGDLVLIKGKYIKLINSIYSDGYLAFPRVKGEPAKALPRDCRILERGRSILWEKVR